MEHFEWSKELETGNSEIDYQHKSLVAIVNLIAALKAKDRNKEAYLNVIDQLIEYSIHHFILEEKLIAKTQGAHLQDHRAEHRIFSEKIQKFRLDVESDQSLEPEAISAFLCSWLKDHILKSDMNVFSKIVSPTDKSL